MYQRYRQNMDSDDEEDNYYSHNVPYYQPQNRRLRQDLMELQYRRDKSFADKMMKCN